MKKISILIPVYNTSKYLERCLNSIVNQSLKNIEIICVNDGSTDNSLEILNKYEKLDNRIKIINKKNGGSSSARNEALKITRGEYCLNIDSDDWIEQGYLKEIYEKAKNENLDMVISDIIFDYEYKKEIKIRKDLSIKDDEILSGEEYLNIYFKNNFHGYTWNKLIKREHYITNNLFYNENIFLFEDAELIAKISLKMKRIGKINKAYYHYIQGENNGSKKVNFKMYLDIEKCFDGIIDYYNLNGIIKYNKILNNRRLFSLYDNLISRDYIKDSRYKEKRDSLLKKIDFVDKDIVGLMNSKNISLYFKLKQYFPWKILLFEGIKKLVLLKKYIFKN